MTTQILRLEQQQAWPMHASWMSGSAWSKQRLTDHSSDSSWEVRAFAEDASSSGQWPPRSYSCSFCQREFRTAQALGGHMNVHRRERAHQNQLANLRNLRLSSASKSQQPTSTVDLLSPKAEQRSLPFSGSPLTNPSTTAALSSSPPSQESINSCCSLMTQQQEEQTTTKPLLNLDILCETLSQQRTDVAAGTLSWTPSRALYYHPYEKSSAAARCKPADSGSQRRFSLCLNKVMGEVHDDVLVDLELRLGRSSCAV